MWCATGRGLPLVASEAKSMGFKVGRWSWGPPHHCDHQVLSCRWTGLAPSAGVGGLFTPLSSWWVPVTIGVSCLEVQGSILSLQLYTVASANSWASNLPPSLVGTPMIGFKACLKSRLISS